MKPHFTAELTNKLRRVPSLAQRHYGLKNTYHDAGVVKTNKGAQSGRLFGRHYVCGIKRLGRGCSQQSF